MPLSAAEKQRRYRERLKNTPDKYEESKKKHRERYHKTKRLVKDLTPKERYNANAIWRLRKQQSVKRKKAVQNLLQNTPPSSPQSSLALDIQDPSCRTPPLTPPPATPPCATPPGRPVVVPAKLRGRNKVKKDRSKVYRENKKLQLENEKLKQKCEKYKKRFLRSNEGKTGSTNKQDKNEKYKILSSAINKTFKTTKSRKERDIIKKIFSTVEIRDSRIKKKLLIENLGIDKVVMTKSALNKETKLKIKIKDFYTRDDISRATAGKKETVTKSGIKVQKRFLLDSMKILYKTFKKENPHINCSYFYFTKNKPFYIVSASVDARDTCLCKTHTNFAYKAKALKKKGITATDDLNLLIESTVCNANSKDCMYGMCEQCAGKTNYYNIDNMNGIVKWTEWVRKKEEYEKDGRMIKSIKNVKEVLEEEVERFLLEYQKDLKAFKRHVFNIKSQFKNFRRCLEEIRPNECIVVVDFSENYNCKYSEEVQSHHFGGSRKQISLHTVVVYTFDGESPKGYEVHSFCTVSASSNHQPAAIWTHLDPVLKWLRFTFSHIDTVYFHSDGPSTQYRQKHNFYLMCTKLFEYGFCNMTWSNFEAGHGKGPADGIGGFLKRSADKIVANGEDIADVFQFYDKLKNASKIKLYLIDEIEIHDQQKLIPDNIPRLIGTLKVHQVFSDSYGTIKYRELSCFCGHGTGKRGFCECFDPKIHDVRTSCLAPDVVIAAIDRATPDYTNDVDIVPLNTPDLTREQANNSDIFNIFNGIPPALDWTSSDDDEPLITIKISKELKEITNRRKSIYEEIYGPPSDEEPCSSYAKDSKIEVGDFLLVKVYVDKSRKKVFYYVCKTLTDIEEDGEVQVMFLRVVDENAKRFRLDDKDIAYVDFDDIVQKLPLPVIVKKGHRNYYEFKDSIHVFEKT